jgi:polysaccharide biosynthesis/export protein
VIRYGAGTSGQTTAGSEGDPSKMAPETIKVDLDGLLLRGEPQWNLVLNPSDLVNIPVAGSVFITGNGIKKPGTYPLTSRMTLQQLVDLAEGLKYEADHDILFVRTMENGEKEVYTIDYDDLRDSKTKDIQLRSGDKVIVDRTIVKTVLAAVGRGISQVFRVVVAANYKVADNENNSNNDNN